MTTTSGSKAWIISIHSKFKTQQQKYLHSSLKITYYSEHVKFSSQIFVALKNYHPIKSKEIWKVVDMPFHDGRSYCSG